MNHILHTTTGEGHILLMTAGDEGHIPLSMAGESRTLLTTAGDHAPLTADHLLEGLTGPILRTIIHLMTVIIGADTTDQSHVVFHQGEGGILRGGATLGAYPRSLGGAPGGDIHVAFLVAPA